MAAFVLFFLLTYSAMHALAYYHTRQLWAGRALWSYLVPGFMVMMILAPLGVRFLEQRGLPELAQALAYTGYVWMGFIFLSFCGFALVTVVDLALRFIRHCGWLRWVRPGAFPKTDGHLTPEGGRSGSARPSPSRATELSGSLLAGRATTLLVLGAALLGCGYGALEAWNIRLERVRLETPKLPPGVPRLTIAQISDVHLGVLVRSARLQRILERVRAAGPDLLVATGDLVDGQLDHLDELAEHLRKVQPRFGKYAITGNHETYAGLDKALEFTRRAGFTVLRDSIVANDLPIQVIGLDYRAAGGGEEETALLQSASQQRFVLLLKHLPVVRPKTLGKFDLQLSGHTHRGQIFPFSFVTKMFFPMQAGLYPLNQGSYLYTSRGSGTWGPPMRLGSPPEVTIIELVRCDHNHPAAPVLTTE
jgi:uncharacterized protein